LNVIWQHKKRLTPLKCSTQRHMPHVTQGDKKRHALYINKTGMHNHNNRE
jgi:hypothetical protein